MKTLLINGGSRGIGAEIVKLFSNNGYQIAFTYKNAYEAAKELSLNTGALMIKADSASTDDINFAVKQTIDAFGKIDVLINNAAVSSFELLQEVSDDKWHNIMSVNIDSYMKYCRAVLPYMISSHYGKIINISSMWGICGASCEVAYSSSKAGVIGFTKALAKEVGPSGINVNAIAPGVIDTDMNKNLSDEDIAHLIDETPMGRIGKCIDIAEAALFLSSDSASFICGEILNVSGGLVI